MGQKNQVSVGLIDGLLDIEKLHRVRGASTLNHSVVQNNPGTEP